MIKLKELLKEGALDRNFGDPLPTLASVMKSHQKDKPVVTEQMDKKLADAMTRYLIGDRKQAVRQLAMLASKIDVEIDQDSYNQQYSDTHRAILKVLKRIM